MATKHSTGACEPVGPQEVRRLVGYVRNHAESIAKIARAAQQTHAARDDDDRDQVSESLFEAIEEIATLLFNDSDDCVVKRLELAIVSPSAPAQDRP